jgi:hypothetical protein
MKTGLATAGAAILLATCMAIPAEAQRAPQADIEARMDAQRTAMDRLGRLDGTWRGKAVYYGPQGPHEITQTERLGPMLDGTIKVVQGRGYEADGSVSFNAFAVIGYDPDTGTYAMQSWNDGREGRFELELSDNGYRWEIPAGSMTIRYEAEITASTYHEWGVRVVEGQDPQKFFDMQLTRVGDTDWPAAGVLGPKQP